MGDIRRDENGRRYKSSKDELGVEVRVYAPAGPDGEHESWPYSGRWYCNSMAGLATDRWYQLELVGYAPDGGRWYAWELCEAPALAIDETTIDLDTAEIQPYDDEATDTLPGVTE